MKKPTKTEITAFLDKLQRRIHSVEKASATLAQTRADVEKFESEITEMGEPDYNDEKAINRLSVLQLRLKSAIKATDTHTVKIGESTKALDELVPPGGELASAVLEQIAINRLETVTGALELYSVSRESARQMALQTDACRGATLAVHHYRRMQGVIRNFTGGYYGSAETPEEYAASIAQQVGMVLMQARKIERVLVETTARAPDMLQFIPYHNDKGLGLTISTGVVSEAAGEPDPEIAQTISGQE